MYKFLVLSILFLFSCEQKEFSLDGHRRSILKIRVTSQAPNYLQPWRTNSTRRSSGTGFYIGKNQIMTNAHVVANGKYITVQKDGDEKPVIARVKFIAHDSDLALLEVKDESYFKGVKELEFGSIPKLRESVVTVGYPKGGEQISFTEGIVSRVGYRRYAHPGYDKHLLIQVDSAINSGNSGGPVLQKDKVIGVAFQSYVNAENTGYIIPTPVIQHFLDDIKDGSYDGHPYMNLHFVKGATENEGTKSYLGISEDESGVLLGAMSDNAPYAKHLKKMMYF